MGVNKYISILFTIFLLSSCSKGIKVVVDDIEVNFDTSMFRGVTPDIYFDELCSVVGEPNEYLDKGRGEDKEHSPR